MDLDALTLSELRHQKARLTLEALRLRNTWSSMVPGTRQAAATGRRMRVLERRAAGYTKILDLITGSES